ncbi:MAG: hypothetical protein R3B96_19280 [Pirellulaceae bacterium]
MNPPAVWELVVFGLLGAVLGAVVNWGVVALRVHLPRPFGPWHEPPEGSRRNWGARLPIIGWWLLRHEESIHGRFYWVRPLSVELAAVIGLPLFWYWSRLGGGYPEEWVALATGEEWSRVWWSWGLFRFIAGVLLVLAMTLATLIDFDEWLIPDEITLTGTLVALLIACLGFGGPLPIRSDTTTGARTIVQVIPEKDPTPRPLTLASPGDLRWTQAEYWEIAPRVSARPSRSSESGVLAWCKGRHVAVRRDQGHRADDRQHRATGAPNERQTQVASTQDAPRHLLVRGHHAHRHGIGTGRFSARRSDLGNHAFVRGWHGSRRWNRLGHPHCRELCVRHGGDGIRRCDIDGDDRARSLVGNPRCSSSSSRLSRPSW